jgi:hypothetical protein
VKELDKELFLHSTTIVCCLVHNALVSTNVTHAVATNATFQKKKQCPARPLTFNNAIKDKVCHYNLNLCGTTTEATYKICCGKSFWPASGHDKIKGIIILLQRY